MKYFSIFFFIIIVSLILILDSCKKDSNTTPDTDARDKYIGTWHCLETDNKKNTYNFDVTISKDPNNSANILLYNFFELGVNTSVTGIVADTKVNINTQKVSNFTISGDGTYVSSSKMTWNYNVNDGANVTPYTADFTK